MIKNEKELQKWFRDYLVMNGIYAKKLETPFARGWSDIYTLHNGTVTWIEMKWLSTEKPKPLPKLIDYIKSLPTALQKKFLNEQVTQGGRAFVVTGFYPNEKVTRGEEPQFFLTGFPEEYVSLILSPQILLNVLWPEDDHD